MNITEYFDGFSKCTDNKIEDKSFVVIYLLLSNPGFILLTSFIGSEFWSMIKTLKNG